MPADHAACPPPPPDPNDPNAFRTSVHTTPFQQPFQQKPQIISPVKFQAGQYNNFNVAPRAMPATQMNYGRADDFGNQHAAGYNNGMQRQYAQAPRQQAAPNNYAWQQPNAWQQAKPAWQPNAWQATGAAAGGAYAQAMGR